MILDKIENSSKYFPLEAGFEKGFKYLTETDMANLTDGRYDIDGDNVFVLISSYDTKNPAEKLPEAHRKYADIQYMISGCEKIGYANLEAQKITKEYNEEKDIIFYDEISFYIKMDEGKFALFLPDDIHMPGIVDGEVKKVKKAVVKVKL
jgi:YhcH/YjgK/YiaL family protein